MAACEVESSGAHKLLVGGLPQDAWGAGQLFVLDLATAQITNQVRHLAQSECESLTGTC